MSRVVERLLPPLREHLCGRRQEAAAASRASQEEEEAVPSAESCHRWQHCFAVWRRVLGSDVLLLALLHHSGCLWAPQYGALRRAAAAVRADVGGRWPSPAAGEAATAVAALMLKGLEEREPASLWALNVLHFMNLIEIAEPDRGAGESGSAGEPDGDADHEDATTVVASDGEGEEEQDDNDTTLNGIDSSSGGGTAGRRRGRARAPAKKRKRPRHNSAGGDARGLSQPAAGAAPAAVASLECSTGLLQDLLPPPFSAAAALGAAGASALSAAAPALSGNGSGGGGGFKCSRRGTVGRPPAGESRAAASPASPTSPDGNTTNHTNYSSTGISWPVVDRQRQRLCTACVAVAHPDEPLVQQTAAWLVDEWFALFSPPHQQQEEEECVAPLRDYWLSCALKLAAYTDGTHSALLEENAHLQAVLARQAIGPDTAAELFHRSIPAIFCCLLRDEVSTPMQQQHKHQQGRLAKDHAATAGGSSGPALVGRPLLLPPPVYFLPFHSLAKGSRVSTWVPEQQPTHGNTRSSNSSGSGRNSDAAPVDRGEFLLFEVVSNGVRLGSGPLSVSLRSIDGADSHADHDGGSGGGGGQQQQLTAAVDRLLPREHNSSAASGPTASRRRLPDKAAAPRRRWSAAEPRLQGHLRVDAYAPRVLFMRPIPARDLSRQDERAQSEADRRRHAGSGSGSHETLLTLLSGLYPCGAADVLAVLQWRLASRRITLSHQRGIGASGGSGGGSGSGGGGSGGSGGRLTLARDGLGTTLQFAHLAARRMLALHGSCITTATTSTSTSAPGGGKGKSGLPGESQQRASTGKGAGACPTDHTVAAGGKGKRAAASPTPPAGPAPWLSWAFAGAEAELAALAECASALTVLVLLLAHGLPGALLDQQSVCLWLTEVAALAADAALLTAAPAARLLRGAGFALCLVPPRAQSVLVAVGLYAALGTRQLRCLLGPPEQQQQQQREAFVPRRRRADLSTTNGGLEDDEGDGGAVHFWWAAFRAAVLADPYLPAQLHSATWALAESVDQSMQAALERRAVGWSAGVGGGDGTGVGRQLTDTGAVGRRILKLRRADTVPEPPPPSPSPLRKSMLVLSRPPPATASARRPDQRLAPVSRTAQQPAHHQQLQQQHTVVPAGPAVCIGAGVVKGINGSSSSSGPAGGGTVAVVSVYGNGATAADEAVSALWASLEQSLRAFMSTRQ